MLALRLLSEVSEGPNTDLEWLLYAGMALFFLMVVVGWWVSSRRQDQPKDQHEAKKSAKKDAKNPA